MRPGSANCLTNLTRSTTCSTNSIALRPVSGVHARHLWTGYWNSSPRHCDRRCCPRTRQKTAGCLPGRHSRKPIGLPPSTRRKACPSAPVDETATENTRRRSESVISTGGRAYTPVVGIMLVCRLPNSDLKASGRPNSCQTLPSADPQTPSPSSPATGLSPWRAVETPPRLRSK